MAQINLQFSAQNDLGSEAIKIFEHGGQFSHVDAIMDNGSLLGARSDVCEGVPAGVQMRPAWYANFSEVKRVVLPCSDTQKASFEGFLLAQLGKAYDSTAILGFMADRDWRTLDSWFCSELQAAALEKAGIFPFSLAAPSNKITPTDLLLACSVLTDVGS